MRDMSSTNDASWLLVQGEDAVLHVLRAHAGVGPHHGHHRNVDLRKNVHGHAQRRADTHQANQDERRDHRIGTFERNFDNGHAESSTTIVPIRATHCR